MDSFFSSIVDIFKVEGQPLSLIPAIEVAVIASAVLGILFYRFRQPALLAYIVAGLVLGIFARAVMGESSGHMQEISHLGLVFLLFIIGLELDLSEILKLGLRPALTVLLQAPLTIALALGLQHLLLALGVRCPGLASSTQGAFIFSVAIALSSTAVAVKLLADKFDLTSQAGKLTVMTLIAQDIWAVLALSYLSSQRGEGTSPWAIAIMLGGAVGAALVMGFIAKKLLSRLFAFLSRSPDLIAMLALGFCFLGTMLLSSIGLSAEMGALIAGLSLGTLPMASEIMAKVSSLRDFFMAVYFVTLGMSLPPPSLGIIGAALALIGVLIASRFLIMTPMLLIARQGAVVALTTPINLAQLSEFSLLLVPLGVGGGMLTAEEGSIISYAMMLSVLIATYGIKYNYPLALALHRRFTRKPSSQRDFSACPAPGEPPETGETGETGVGGTREVSGEPIEVAGVSRASAVAKDIVLLGFFRTAEALARILKDMRPDLIERTRVVDFNLRNHPAIREHGLSVTYGDISDPETLRHHRVGEARLVLSTVGNTFLRGITNQEILTVVKTMNPAVRFIGTAESPAEKERLLEHGAFAAISPSEEAARAIANLLPRALED